MVSATCGGVGCQELHQEGVKKTGHLHHHHCHHHPQGPHCLHHQVLAAVRRGLTGHPLDLRGSRRALEAAQVIVIISNTSFGVIIATIISPPTVAFTLDITHKSWDFLCSQIFLELDGEKKEGVEFLDTTLTIGKADQVLNDVNSLEPSHHIHDQVLEAGGGQGGGSGAPSFVCPTLPCQLFASTVLR